MNTQENIMNVCGGVKIAPSIITRNDITFLTPLIFVKEMRGYVISLYMKFYLYKAQINDNLDTKNINKLVVPAPSIDKPFEECAYHILTENAIRANISVARDDIDNTILAFIIIGTVFFFSLVVFLIVYMSKKN